MQSDARYREVRDADGKEDGRILLGDSLSAPRRRCTRMPERGPIPAAPSAKVTRISVTITPQKATLFVGDTQAFVPRVLGGANKTVTCGTVMNQGLYTAPKIQGVYHVTASSIASPQQRAVATVTVLTYCDVPTTSIG